MAPRQYKRGDWYEDTGYDIVYDGTKWTVNNKTMARRTLGSGQNVAKPANPPVLTFPPLVQSGPPTITQPLSLIHI